MDGREDIKGNEGKGGGSVQGIQCVGVRVGGGAVWDRVRVFHKALGSTCVSKESKPFTAYHTSHKACMEDNQDIGKRQTCTNPAKRHQHQRKHDENNSNSILKGPPAGNEGLILASFHQKINIQ